MGCVTGQQHTVEINHPHVNRVRSFITKYLQIMRLDNPLNINKKYEHICKINMSETTGEGCRRVLIIVMQTNAYDCLGTEAEFYTKRKEFWETRTSGDKQCWATIELAIESEDQSDVRAILQSVGIRMLNNSIQMCIDDKIDKYEVPIFCINMPRSFSKTTVAQTNLSRDFQEKPLAIKVRSTKFVKDAIINTKTTTTVEELIASYIQQQKLSTNSRVRLFYRGRQMMPQFYLGNYAFRDKQVAQAMIVGA